MEKQPWEEEEDRKEWVAHGLACEIMRAPKLRHLCGYVGLPRTHPNFGDGYDDIDVDVHGGLTYAEEGTAVTHSAGLWWVGFDCAHFGDLVPSSVDGGYSDDGVYRDMEYVTEETERLALQLAKAREPGIE